MAAEVQRLAPGSVTALTLAAEIAGAFDEDHDRAAVLLDEALDAPAGPALGPWSPPAHARGRPAAGRD